MFLLNRKMVGLCGHILNNNLEMLSALLCNTERTCVLQEPLSLRGRNVLQFNVTYSSLIRYDSAWSGTRVLIFHRIILPPFSGLSVILNFVIFALKTQALWVSETLVFTCLSTRCKTYNSTTWTVIVMKIPDTNVHVQLALWCAGVPLPGESMLSGFVVCFLCSSEGRTFGERRSLWEFPTHLLEHIALFWVNFSVVT